VFVHEVAEAIAGLAVKHGKDVILDNTNLSQSQINLANALKSKFRLEGEVIDFTEVDVEECIKRDAGRANPVGSDVIQSQLD
ncbi:AAA family ATPase, partial [Streptococcus pneumoniae]|uniref:AAA family ATPase n=1 Tax=Streptococcus pneumoniae TaxID=1313 RepID=UPI001E2B89E9